MTTHNADPLDAGGYYAEEPEPDHPHLRLSPPLVVVLSVVAAITLICLVMVMTHAAEQAESVLVLALLIGSGMAVGFRKRWNH